MLYVSTRNRIDSFTSYRAVHEERAPDGGLFVPHRLPVFTKDEILVMREDSFGENVARLLNLFFSAGLSGWDVDFLIGRKPYGFTDKNHRLVIAELWRNHKSDYSYLEQALYQKLSGSVSGKPTDWAKIAIRVAILFGLVSKLSHTQTVMDIAVPAEDFSLAMAAWYARFMGLPIGTIVCGCSENSGVWDLIHRGEMNTGSQVVNLERLIYSTLGLDETLRYLKICQSRGTYLLSEENLTILGDRLAAAVVSRRRTDAVITSIYRTNRYILDASTAIAYGGLQDYRARTGESRPTLLVADHSPASSEEMLCAVLGISNEQFRNLL